MNKNSKVGIITFHYYINYGSALQSFAMQTALENLGYNVEIIDYIQTDSKGKIIFRKCQNKLMDIVYLLWWNYHGDKDYFKLKRAINKDFEERKKCFHSFFQCFYNLSSRCYSKEELKKTATNYDCVICGSDQIWNFRHSHYHMAYLLNFLGDEISKMSYAASIGVQTIPLFWRWLYKKYLKDFKAISVREETAVEILKKVIEKSVELVLDPTFLISVEQWKCLSKCPQINMEYIFCYFLGYNKENIRYAQMLKKRFGLKIVVIKHLLPHCSKEYEEFGDIVLNIVAPDEFLGWIMSAKYVCTDSFHGTVFSILFEKNFLSFCRYKEGSKKSENIRVEALLNVFNIDRMVMYEEDLKKVDKEIAYENVKKIMDVEIEKSINFLRSNLDYEELQSSSS